jgi:hypothetical protein
MMEIVDARKIKDGLIKVGFRCANHSGITYWMMEKDEEQEKRISI